MPAIACCYTGYAPRTGEKEGGQHQRNRGSTRAGISNDDHHFRIKVSYKPKENLGPIIDSSSTATGILRALYADNLIELREEFIVLFLNRANRVKGWSRISEGGFTGTVADPRVIIGIALKSASCSIILSHNHPSGSLKPSTANREITRKIKEAGLLLDIRVLDHIILTREGSMSFADEGLM